MYKSGCTSAARAQDVRDQNERSEFRKYLMNLKGSELKRPPLGTVNNSV